MKHMNPKLAGLLIEGFSINTLENLTSKQIEVLYEKVKSSKGEVEEQPKLQGNSMFMVLVPLKS